MSETVTPEQRATFLVGDEVGYPEDNPHLIKSIAKAIAESEDAAYERAAQVCDEKERHKWEVMMNGGKMEGVGPSDCAAAIRALKSKPATQEGE